MNKEIWKDIIGFEGEYQISNFGRIRSLDRRVNTWNGYKTLKSQIIKQRLRNGYLYYKKFTSTHRLVAIHFIANPQNKPQVNHIDGNKLNNHVDNLEWCTAKENSIHAWGNGLCSEETKKKMSEKAKLRTGKKNSCWRGYIDILDKNDNFIIQKETLKDAQKFIIGKTGNKSVSRGAISRVCNNKQLVAYGYKYKYNKIKKL